MHTEIGDKFQKDTKYSREKFLGGYLDWANKPDTYKKHPSTRIIKLSKKFPTQTLTLVEVLRKRKSTRSFSPKPLSLDA